jgi:SAM-dependent methyltransferase
MDFLNSYEDNRRARAYDELGYGGTYLLVFNTLPGIFSRFAKGKRALDFGCGTGRSTRFLKRHNFDTAGIDISEEMVVMARQNDQNGDYRIICDGDFSSFEKERFDLILSAFPFDNIPGRSKKVHLFSGLMRLLQPSGILVNIVSTPEIYINEWVTFTTEAFPENRNAKCGEIVKIITTDYSDQRPVEDILWPHEDYLSVYQESGVNVIHCEAPLATGDEGIDWKSETRIPPWRIYVLQKAHAGSGSGTTLGQ